MVSKFNSHKKNAIHLRKLGKSYGEIRLLLKANIPKSTLSYWCKNVKLPPSYQKRIDKIINVSSYKGRLIALEVNRIKREEYLNKLLVKNKYLLRRIKDKNTAKIALAMLYWSEGSKSTKGAVVFGNSDPGLIKLFLVLLKRCYGINRDRLVFRIQCRADQDLPGLEEFWLGVTKINRSMMRKASIDPRTKGKPSRKKNYKGVCRIDYFSAHTYNDLMAICNIFGSSKK